MKYKIKFWSEFKKVGKSYKIRDHQIIITKEDFKEMTKLFNDDLGREVESLRVFLGEKIK